MIKVISWNMNKRKKGNWEWIINKFNPDYLLVQEASPLPEKISSTVRSTTKKSNKSAFYSRTKSHERLKMSTDSGMGLIVTKSEDFFL